MPVSVQLPGWRKDDDPIEKLANAVSVAKSVYGIYADSKTLDQTLTKKAEEDKLRGLQIKEAERKEEEAQRGNQTNTPLVKAARERARLKGIILPDDLTESQVKSMGIIDDLFKPAPPKDPIVQELTRERLDEAKRKKEREKNELEVPGYERTGTVSPKPEEAAKFRKATAVSKQLAGKINRMKELVKQYGSFENGGTGGTEMSALATEIQLLGKSPELYELGVLTGPDLDLLNKITANPDSLSSFFTRDSSRQTQLDTQLKSIQQKLATTAESMGYRPVDPSQPPPAGDQQMAGNQPPPGGVTAGGKPVQNVQAAAAEILAKRRSQAKK